MSEHLPQCDAWPSGCICAPLAEYGAEQAWLATRAQAKEIVERIVDEYLSPADNPDRPTWLGDQMVVLRCVARTRTGRQCQRVSPYGKAVDLTDADGHYWCGMHQGTRVLYEEVVRHGSR